MNSKVERYKKSEFKSRKKECKKEKKERIQK